MPDYSYLLGKKVAFVPVAVATKGIGPMHTVKGVVEYVHPRHGWFMIRYKVGRYEFRECCKITDLGNEVTICGK